MDISKLCRSCIKEVASWEKENFDVRAVEMFCFCTRIMIQNDEKLPKQFCYDCVIRIESCYKFIKEAQNVDATLRNLSSRTETSVIVEPETLTKVADYKDQNKLQLTLPDYKLSIGVSDFSKHDSCMKDYNAAHNQNFQNNIKDCNIPIENQQKHNLLTSPKINLRERMKKVINFNEKKNVCNICKKAFTSKVWHMKHMEKEHSGNKYVCPVCQKSFSKPSQLAYHAASHSDERKYSCTSCGKSFKHRKQLTIHIRAHSDVRPFACDKCSMRFKMKSVLKCHMKVHEETKAYLCSVCGWSFSQASNLKVHLRTHTGAKPHACDQCGFRAAAASSLRRHQRRHAGKRLHVCAHCRKGFYDASGLARHVRTHTGELPYKCPGCTRSFADSWKRKTHLMRAHRLALTDIPRLQRDGRTLP